MEKKKDYTLLIIIVLILLSILGLISFNGKEEKKEVVTEPNYSLLYDYSKFFTVESCVYKYISYLSLKDYKSVLEILENDYITKNNIILDNVNQYVDNLDGVYSFAAKKIYYQEIKSNYIRYYVYGNLIKEVMDEKGEKSDYYIIVNIDSKNNLFSISPYDGKIFKEVKDE